MPPLVLESDARFQRFSARRRFTSAVSFSRNSRSSGDFAEDGAVDESTTAAGVVCALESLLLARLWSLTRFTSALKLAISRWMRTPGFGAEDGEVEAVGDAAGVVGAREGVSASEPI